MLLVGHENSSLEYLIVKEKNLCQVAFLTFSFTNCQVGVNESSLVTFFPPNRNNLSYSLLEIFSVSCVC